jgi:hypothetical protein
VCQGCTCRVHTDVAREETTVVWGYASLCIALVHGEPESCHVVPKVSGVSVEDERRRSPPLSEFAGACLESMLAVRAVGPIRQQILVLGVGDEQKPEEDRQGLFVEVPERLLVKFARMPAR